MFTRQRLEQSVCGNERTKTEEPRSICILPRTENARQARTSRDTDGSASVSITVLSVSARVHV